MLEIKTAKKSARYGFKKRQILLPLELFADAYRKSDSAAGAKNRSINIEKNITPQSPP